MALGDEAQREQDRGEGDRQVDVKNRRPSDVGDQPSAEERSDRRRCGAGRGPDADRSSALLSLEGGVEQREAVGQQKRRSDALQSARGEQHRQARRQGAPQRRRREQASADDQQAPPPEMIAERSAEQQQCRQRQQIGIDHPLHFGRARAVALPDRGQGNVEHRPFDEGEARGEDASDKRPGGMTPGTRAFAGPGAHSAVSTF
jgi:hypothetical protein